MAPWSKARRPNGKPMLAIKGGIPGSSRQDGFRCPHRSVVKDFGTARDHKHRGTYPGGLSASASAFANSVSLKNETG